MRQTQWGLYRWKSGGRLYWPAGLVVIELLLINHLIVEDERRNRFLIGSLNALYSAVL